MSAIQPGVTRAEAEATLGSPVREWTSGTLIRFALYQYDHGHVPSFQKAAGFLLLDAITLGFSELYAVATPLRDTFYNPALNRRTIVRVVISYDQNEHVLGIFDEFDELPADGRSGPRTWEP